MEPDVAHKGRQADHFPLVRRRAGSGISALLRWETLEKPRFPFRVSVVLIAPLGTVHAFCAGPIQQNARPRARGTFPTAQVLELRRFAEDAMP